MPDNYDWFKCHSCEKTIEKKNNMLTVTCPKCGVESEVTDKEEYFSAGGVICYNCKNTIPKNKKFENRRENWEEKMSTKEKVGTAAAVGFAGIGTIVLVIGFLLLCFLMLFIL